MKVLFTGSSSFTGFWFIKSLVKYGYEVDAIYTKKSVDNYNGIRKTRVSSLKEIANPIWNCVFGDSKFISLLEQNNYDLICHHAAHVENYKSNEFDIPAALKANTFNLLQVLDLLKQNKSKLIITGSVFEAEEGIGSDEIFSPYGLSKSMTSQIIKYHCTRKNIPLGKFIIPNPFGPFEDARFTTFLIYQWKDDKTPSVKTPLYIRDNIHISLLSEYYIKFCEKVKNMNCSHIKFNPSGYIESQGDFTRRFAENIRKHLNLSCKYELADQKEFNEPKIKLNNSDAFNHINWSEETAWKELADYYNKYLLVKN